MGYGIETLQQATDLSQNYYRFQVLRNDIIHGKVTSEQFVQMSAKELAPKDISKKREEVARNELDSKAGDKIEKAREQMQIENGIDPNAGGEFQCRK